MSNYDKFIEENPNPKIKGRAPRPKQKSNPDGAWNLLTIVMLLMTFFLCFVFTSIWSNPNSSLNPFAPPTLVPPPATATWTPVGYVATWTPTVTVPPSATSTRRPTFTPYPSATAFVLPSATPNYTPTLVTSPTRTPRPTGVPYTITATYPLITTFRSDTTCDSMYVAGRAMDSKNKPVVGLQVKLGGSLPGKTFVPVLTTLSGISPVYGQSGFEFDLKLAPIASNKTLWVQLYDQSGSPLSEQYKFITYGDCKKNLVFILFQQK